MKQIGKIVKTDRFQIGIVVLILSYVFYTTIIRGEAGKGKYNTEIVVQKNMIAYSCSYASGSPFKPADKQIYLLDVSTGTRQQLTVDRYEYGAVDWSPDGERLLFTSHRNTEPGARFDSSKDPNYLVIYNLKTQEEHIIQHNIRQEIEARIDSIQHTGQEVYIADNPEDRQYIDGRAPRWVTPTQISFLHTIPIGTGWGYQVLCTSDTLGKHLRIYRDYTVFPQWRMAAPQWITPDTVLVLLGEIPGLSYVHYAFFLPQHLEYILLGDRFAEGSYPELISGTHQVLYYLEREESIVQVIEDLYTGQQERIILPHFDHPPRGYVMSPHETKIAFLRKTGPNEDIYIMDRNGSHVRRLTSDGGDKFSLVWNPVSTF